MKRAMTRREFAIIVGLAGGSALMGSAAEALVPGGIIRRALTQNSFEGRKGEYLLALKKDATAELIDDINRERTSNGLNPLITDAFLRELAQSSADATSQMPSIGGEGRLTVGAQVTEKTLDDIYGHFQVQKQFSDITVAATSVLGIDNSGRENHVPFISTFDSNSALPINPILTKSNLTTIGVGVALDSLTDTGSNRILFVVAAEKAH